MSSCYKKRNKSDYSNSKLPLTTKFDIVDQNHLSQNYLGGLKQFRKCKTKQLHDSSADKPQLDMVQIKIEFNSVKEENLLLKSKLHH